VRDRWLGLALGVLLLTALSAAGPDCPPGFRCGPGGDSIARCLIEDGPYRGQPGTLVDGVCLASVEGSAGGGTAAHQHVIQSGTCPLCGGTGESFLSFNVQVPGQGGASGSRSPTYQNRAILRCPRCGNLFAG